jgi:hypothetical protein
VPSRSSRLCVTTMYRCSQNKRRRSARNCHRKSVFVNHAAVRPNSRRVFVAPRDDLPSVSFLGVGTARRRPISRVSVERERTRVGSQSGSMKHALRAAGSPRRGRFSTAPPGQPVQCQSPSRSAVPQTPKEVIRALRAPPCLLRATVLARRGPLRAPRAVAPMRNAKMRTSRGAVLTNRAALR